MSPLLLWFSSFLQVYLHDAGNFLAAQAAQLHVALGSLASADKAYTIAADLLRHVSHVKAYTIAQVPGFQSRVLEAIRSVASRVVDSMQPVAQAIAVFFELHYRSTLQHAFKAAVSFAVAAVDSLDVLRRNTENIVAAAAAAAVQQQQAVSLNAVCVVATNLALIYLLSRFLATCTFVLLHPLSRLSPRAVIPSPSTFYNTEKLLHALPHPYTIIDALALSFYLLHHLGFKNLPPHKPGESLLFRYASITTLVPLWCCALTAAMVLFTFGTVTDFLSRTVMGIFRRQPKPAEWHSLDVERGQWQPASAASSEDMTKMPSSWSITNPKVWEDLRRDQGALQQERISFDAEKAAFQAEAQRAIEEKRAFDLEKQRLREERLAFQQQQQKFQKEILASAAARKEVEGIIKMFIEKSKRGSEIIGNLRTRVDALPVINGNLLGNPTPPASPKMEKGYRSEKVEFAKGYAQSQRKARIQAAATAIAV